MNSGFSIIAILIALTVLVGACAPQATPTAAPPTQAPASQGSAAMPTGPAQVAVGQSSKFSSFLVDDKGMTLYLYTKDTPNTATCYDKCATAWPPLLTAGNPVAGTGVDASKIGTTKRTDGTMQVTYNGWPLYYFSKDKQAGETNGENVASVWFVVSPTGDAMK